MFLLATIVGSGIMAESLAGGNNAIALLGNALATGCMLYVLITVLGPISGAHFNPAVTMAMGLQRQLSFWHSSVYVLVQLLGAIAGCWLAHLMFDTEILQTSGQARTGIAQWISEVVATFGLVSTILFGLKFKPHAVAALVGIYISAAYWFAASTSFANPAVTVARALTDTFSGIDPSHAPAFIACQLVGAVLAVCGYRLTVK